MLMLIMMGVLQDHVLDLHQTNIERYAAYAAGFYGKITRNLVVQMFYHKKLETFLP